MLQLTIYKNIARTKNRTQTCNIYKNITPVPFAPEKQQATKKKNKNWTYNCSNYEAYFWFVWWTCQVKEN